MSAEDVAEQIQSILDGQSVAVVGGAEWKEEGHTEPLRESDQKALESSTVDVDETVKAVYGVNGDELVNAVGDRNVYLSGGTIANPYARILSGAEPQRVDKISLGELAGERRFPLAFDAETLSSRDFNQTDDLQRRAEKLRDRNNSYEDLSRFNQALVAYVTPAAEFRVNEELRPNYTVDRSHGKDGANVENEFQRLFLADEDGVIELGETQKEEYLSRRFTPVANGNDWQTDYAVLGVHENPVADGEVVAAQGAHHLATSGANDIITYPDSDYEGTETVLERIGEFQDKTGADEYQAVIQTNRNPATGEIQNNLYAVGEL